MPPAVPSISPGEKCARSSRTCRRRGPLAADAEAAGDGLAGAERLADGLTVGDGVGACKGDTSALGDASIGVASGIDGDADAMVVVGTVVAGGSVAGGGGGEGDDEQAAPSIKRRIVFPAMEMPGRVERMPREMQEKCHAPA